MDAISYRNETTAELKRLLIDYGRRLSLCSNSGEGRKIRKELGLEIIKIERQLKIRDIN